MAGGWAWPSRSSTTCWTCRGDDRRWASGVGKDAERGKLTFPGLLGIEGSRAGARTAGRRGVRGAGAVWRPCRALESLARYVLERNR